MRSVSPSIAATIPESPGAAVDDVFSSSPVPTKTLHALAFYPQPDPQLDPDRRASPTKSSSGRKRSWQDSDIPPVPPLPKELLLNAAKVNVSPTKKSVPAKEGDGALGEQSSSALNLQPSALEKYPWPDDFF